MSRAASLLAVLALGLAAAPPLPAQVAYDVAFPNAVHHEARIRVTLTGAPRGRPVEFRMSSSSPGRYALTGFAKNVYEVGATDGRGRPLAVTRTDPSGWQVTGHDGTVTLAYTLFGDRGDGTYAQVDATHAHLNMPAAFMFARGFDARPIRITFHPPAGSGWRIATQLFPTDDSLTFTAPGLQYFMDSPTELSAFTLRTWELHAGGRTTLMRLALHHTGTEQEADAYAELARRVVDQAVALWGEPPAFDGGTYTFIADYLPWASGDGMEHRNSTILASTGSLARSMNGLIGTLSHEFFHAWNMERLRARAIEPFDFDRANMSGELWFGEGFTSYFAPLILRRAGHTSVADYARGLGFGVSALAVAPGRRYFGPVGMSQQAPWRDGAAALDPTNAGNVFLSYYTYGAALGLALDLTLRTRFDGLSGDGYLRRLWADFGRPERPYTLADLERTLGAYTGDAAFAADFFGRYVRGSDLPDFAPLLARAGFLLRPGAPGAAFLGLVQLDYDERGATIQSGTAVGSPLYDAGLDRLDRIVTLDGRPLVGDSVWAAVKAAHRPGDVVTVEYESRGRRLTARVPVVADPRLEVVTYEQAGLPVTEAITAFRRAWLGAER